MHVGSSDITLILATIKLKFHRHIYIMLYNLQASMDQFYFHVRLTGHKFVHKKND